jgi:hypothetical protein
MYITLKDGSWQSDMIICKDAQSKEKAYTIQYVYDMDMEIVVRKGEEDGPVIATVSPATATGQTDIILEDGQTRQTVFLLRPTFSAARHQHRFDLWETKFCLKPISARSTVHQTRIHELIELDKPSQPWLRLTLGATSSDHSVFEVCKPQLTTSQVEILLICTLVHVAQSQGEETVVDVQPGDTNVGNVGQISREVERKPSRRNKHSKWAERLPGASKAIYERDGSRTHEQGSTTREGNTGMFDLVLQEMEKKDQDDGTKLVTIEQVGRDHNGPVYFGTVG